ncbi:Biotin synthase [Acidisarcina polymorpha]|uniref:Biotin synthase n=1 Tax=Acidisarcina polymorpha TaxID=2211140 RepID=A0A2Z5G7F0_9BACT|nr:biotin synthase BioB [Acidisarcina polymorpha]AXC14900.1 Biotin synthase [Acidisarcina polymorpha]
MLLDPAFEIFSAMDGGPAGRQRNPLGGICTIRPPQVRSFSLSVIIYNGLSLKSIFYNSQHQYQFTPKTEILMTPETAAHPTATATITSSPRWTSESARNLYELPFNDLLFQAHSVHRANFDPNRIQLSKLLSIKTGGCPEDCGYCSQSARYPTGLRASKLMEVERVVAEAQKAKEGGATRYCMGAAWRSPKQRDMDTVVAMVQGVKALGLETCMTLGMLSPQQAESLSEAGLDYYNHNIDTSKRFYGEVITTRTFGDRLETLENVRQAGIKVCAGGIIGMGEAAEDRIDMLVTLANLPSPPESVPINMLIPIPGSKLADAPPVDPIDFVRVIALARILMPGSHVRLSAGRTNMTDELQALCFFAGANSIFVGDTLLTAANPGDDRDSGLLRRLGIRPEASDAQK